MKYKNIAFLVVAVLALLFGIGQFVTWMDGKMYTPGMSKASAEARSNIMLREPTNCWGDTDGWQCQGQDTKVKWVTCLGDHCYRTK